MHCPHCGAPNLPSVLADDDPGLALYRCVDCNADFEGPCDAARGPATSSETRVAA